MPTGTKAPTHDDWLKRYSNGCSHPSFERLQRCYRLLHSSQFWTRGEIRAFQFERLRKQYSFAREHVPFYKMLYADQPCELSSWECFARLPIITREEMSRAGNDRMADSPPRDAKPYEPMYTSGSTGHVLKVISTDAAELFRMAVSIRELEWLDLNPGCDGLICRALAKPSDPQFQALRNGVMMPTWSPAPIENLVPSGRGFYIDVGARTSHIANFFDRTAPEFVLCNPSALFEVAKLLPAGSPARQSIRKIRTIGELLVDAHAEALEEAFHADIQDHYSAAEVSAIATTAPDGGGHLVHDENVLVEVVREDGSECELGEQGRVLVTNLHPYITPSIRYDIGDIAIRGETRGIYGLSRIEKLIGRARDMIRLASDDQMHSSGLFLALHRVEGLRGVIIKQLGVGRFHLQVAQGPNCPLGIESRVLRVIEQTIPNCSEVLVAVVEDLPRSEGGKLHKFRCVQPESETP